MITMSSETSEEYYRHSQGHYVPVDGRTVNQLTSNLKDTSHNLQSLDKMLGAYRNISMEQRSAVDRLRDELDQTHDEVREEQYRGAELYERNYLSDNENSRGRSRKRRPSVKFADDMRKELHNIHGTVRDLSAEQLKMEETFNREIERRDRHDRDTKKSLRELNNNVRQLSPDPLTSRVERRLQAIQNDLKSDRYVPDRNSEMNTLSTEIKAALQNQPSRDEVLRHEYLASETYRHKLDLDLDNVKRRLDQSEGSKHALQQQVEDLRSLLTAAEQDRHRSKLQMDQLRMEEDFRMRQMTTRQPQPPAPEYIQESRTLEREIYELKNQLGRSVSAVTEVEDLRRTVDKSERQRAQLSDHIETLVKDLENRDKINAKLITELKEVTDKYNVCEHHKNSLSAQFDEVTNKFRETTRNYELTSNELRDTQSSLQSTEKKKDEFKGRAQETVRQWKMKVKQLESELDRHKHSGSEMMNRNEQLIKEMEALRHGTNHSLMHVDAIKRELADALAIRATQEEQLRIRDIEVNELKSYKMDLERDMRDTRPAMERLEFELHNCQTNLLSVTQDKSRLEERLSSVEASQMLSQDQTLQIQSEFSKMSSVKAELSAQLSEASEHIHGLKQQVIELQHKAKAAQEESEIYKRKLLEERGGHQSGVENLRDELNTLKNREAQTKLEVSRRFKHGLAEYEAMINALKVDLSEERSARKIAKQNEEGFLNKISELESRLKDAQEESIALLQQMDNLRITNDSRASFLHQDDVNRVQKLEDSLLIAQSELKRLEKNQHAVIAEIAKEIDELLVVASYCPSAVYQPLNGKNGIFGSVCHLIADVKNKLKWLKSEIEVRVSRESKWQRALQEVLTGTEKDRSYLMKELLKQEGQIDDIIAAKEDLVLTLKQCA